MVIIIIVWVKSLYTIAPNGAFTEKNYPLSTLTTFSSTIYNS